MTDIDRLRRELLEAREARSHLIADLAGPSPSRKRHGSLIFVSTNVPGPDKRPLLLDFVVDRTVLSALRLIPGSFLVRRGVDAIGPFAVLLADASPIATKLSTVRLEEEVAWGRVVDLDVYDEGERLVDRGSLGLGPRPCFVCPEPAHECMRTGRHPAVALQRAVARLLDMASRDANGPIAHRAAEHIDGTTMGRALIAGARAELDLTPKPGLVDGHDNGSHPDLTYDLMRRSIDLLPEYFDELVAIACTPARLKPRPTVDGDENARPSAPYAGQGSSLAKDTDPNAGRGFSLTKDTAPNVGRGFSLAKDTDPNVGRGFSLAKDTDLNVGRGFSLAGDWPDFDLAACVDAGRRAEARMLAATGSNTHRGLIFLGGLAVLAACPSVPADVTELRTRIALLSGLLVGGQPPNPSTNGGVARLNNRLGGIQHEAVLGLPAVFDHALPLFRRLLAGPRPSADFAPFGALAALMQQVEDTTAVHRCGMAGLARIHEDGAALQRAIERGDDPRPQLSGLNDDYRAMHLTMGGVADCLAVTFGVGFVVEA